MSPNPVNTLLSKLNNSIEQSIKDKYSVFMTVNWIGTQETGDADRVEEETVLMMKYILRGG